MEEESAPPGVCGIELGARLELLPLPDPSLRCRFAGVEVVSELVM